MLHFVKKRFRSIDLMLFSHDGIPLCVPVVRPKQSRASFRRALSTFHCHWPPYQTNEDIVWPSSASKRWLLFCVGVFTARPLRMTCLRQSQHWLGPPWLLGPVSRQNSLNSFFSLYKNPIDLNLNPISSESDEIGIQTQMFKMASRARIAILRNESSRIVARFAKCIVCLCV